jgi:FkbM family methyltransferase
VMSRSGSGLCASYGRKYALGGFAPDGSWGLAPDVMMQGAHLTRAVRTWIVFAPRLVLEVVLAQLCRRSIHARDTRIVDATRWGLSWSLDLKDNLQRRLYFAHSYEAATLFQVARRMRSDDVIVDVGANVGTFLLPLLRHIATHGRGLAVEPAADTAARLVDHIGRNGMTGRVRVAGVALSVFDGTGTLVTRSARDDDTGLRSLGSVGQAGATVVVRRGDNLMRELGISRIDILKVDVEGGEYAALSGLEAFLRRVPPRVVLVELIHSRKSGSPDHVGSIVELMQRLGYRGRWVRFRGLSEISHETARNGNALFVRKCDPSDV